MRYIADFHIHSKYSRATSKEMNLENLDKRARIKGIQIVGTGDFTHPEWLEEIKEKLEPVEQGLFQLKNSNSPTRFLLTSEISCVYSKKGKVRKIHIVLFAPSLEAVEELNTQLSWIGNLKSDGRPILGLDGKELAKIALEISPDFFIVPAHIWTPWFGILGSKSGFDSLEECFDDYSKHIYALETGLSADPPMCWRVSALDKYTLISNSDAHSPAKLGREVNIFEGENIDYFKIVEAIKKGGKPGPSLALEMKATIEFFPEEGKYHYDGHRNCGIRFSPEETKKYNGICPVCGRPLTLGVLYRVEQLADRPPGYKPKTALPFYSLVPLEEVIADVLGLTSSSQQVKNEYNNLLKHFDNEFNILLDVPQEDLEKITKPKIAEGIIRVREGKVTKEPGYDGVFGKIKIFGNEEKEKELNKQKTLF